MTELQKAKVALYAALLNVDPEELEDDDVEIMAILAGDEDIQMLLKEKMLAHKPS